MTDDAKPLLGEIWMLERLTEHCRAMRNAFTGITDATLRKQRLRQAISVHGLDLAVCGRDPSSKKPQTFAEAFQRLYGEKL